MERHRVIYRDEVVAIEDISCVLRGALAQAQVELSSPSLFLLNSLS